MWRYARIITASLGMFLGALDITVNVALPIMTRDLGTDLQTIQWVIVLYVGLATALQLGMGPAADRFGVRRFYLLGIGIYGLAVLLIGLVPDLAWLLGLRLLQAVGFALLLATGPALVALLVPRAERGAAFGLMVGMGTLGGIAGSLIGGLLVDEWGWRAAFVLRVPVCILALVLGLALLPRDAPVVEKLAGEEPGPGFDVYGAIYQGIAVGAFVIGLTLLGRDGWSDPVVLSVSALCALAVVLFIRNERRVAKPLIELSLLKNPLLVLIVAAGFTNSFATFTMMFLFPFFVTDIMGEGALVLGGLIMTTNLAAAVAAPIGGWLADRVSDALLATLSLLVGTGALAWFSAFDASYVWQDAVLPHIVLGVSLGVFPACSSSMAMNNIPIDRVATGSSILALSRSLGLTASVAVLSALFATLRARYGVSMSEPDAFVLAFRHVYWVATGISVVSVVLGGLCLVQKTRVVSA